MSHHGQLDFTRFNIYIFLRQGLSVKLQLSYNSIYRPGQVQNSRLLPSASCVLRLEVCATSPVCNVCKDVVADKLLVLDGYSVKYISYGSLDKQWILHPTELPLCYAPIIITNKSCVLLQKVECLDYTFYIIKDRELYTWRIKYPLGSSSYKLMNKPAREAILYLCLFLMETGASSF